MNNYLLLFLGITLLACSNQEDKAKQTPNIILFLVDDLGWQDTSVPFWTKKTPLNQRYHTPNMERLASEGMKFTQAYATPVCSPSRISLITGMNAARHRVTNWTLRKDQIQPMERNHPSLDFPFWNVNGLGLEDTLSYSVKATPLPLLLKDAGYYTVHAGKAHWGAIGTSAEDPVNIGFDINIAGHAAGAPKSYLGTENFGNLPQFEGQPWLVPGLEEYHGEDIFLTEVLTRKALEAIQTPIKKGQAFFLNMSLYGVHTPIMADNRFVQTYYDLGLDSTEAKYASMIAAMDKSLGDIMDFLEKENLVKNTAILFMSDNGGLSAVARGGKRHTHNAPLSSGKGSIREGGIREPMMVKWPNKVLPNSTCDDYLIIEDFFATILEIAGVEAEVKQTVDGQSFVPLLKGESMPKRPLFWHYPNAWGPTGPGIAAYSAIRLEDWKLIYYHDSELFELFNINKDIGETNNLAAIEKDHLLRLANQLSDYLIAVDAQMPSHKETGKQVVWPKDAAIHFLATKN